MEPTGRTQPTPGSRGTHCIIYESFWFSGEKLGTISFSRRSSRQLLATTFQRGFKAFPTVAHTQVGKGTSWVFSGRGAGCCHFQTNSFGPHLGLELPSRSPGKEAAKSKVADEMRGPWGPQVTYHGLGEEPWHEKTDGWKRQTSRSIAVSATWTLLKIVLHQNTSRLNLLAVFKTFSLKQSQKKKKKWDHAVDLLPIFEFNTENCFVFQRGTN